MIGQAYEQGFKIGDRVRIKNLQCAYLSVHYQEGEEAIITRICKDGDYMAVFNDEAECYVGAAFCDIELVDAMNILRQAALEEYRELGGEDNKFYHDEVNHPPHYNQGDIECIEAQKAALSAEEFRGYLKGQVMKYTWRMGLKGKVLVDAQKAKYYQDKLVEFLKEDAS